MTKDKALAAADLPVPNRILREEFLARQKRNPRYSTRSWARDLGVSHAYACLMLVGKRKVSAKRAAELAIALRLDKSQTERFLEAVRHQLIQRLGNSGATYRSNFIDLEVDRFKVLQEWYHVAILDLTLVKGFKPQAAWVAKRLGISALAVRDAVERLERLGLLEVTPKAWTKTQAKIFFRTARAEESVRHFHAQMMERARLQLDERSEAAYARREISGMTLALRGDRIAEAKKLIQNFQRQIADFVTEGPADELYQFNVQFFPLTQE